MDKHDGLNCVMCTKVFDLREKLNKHIESDHSCKHCDFQGNDMELSSHLCDPGDREHYPTGQDNLPFTIWKPMTRQQRLKYIRGYVSCGRCGESNLNPNPKNIRWVPLENTTNNPQEITAQLLLYKIYPGYDLTTVYVKRNKNGFFTHYSSWRNCRCLKYIDETLEELTLGPKTI